MTCKLLILLTLLAGIAPAQSSSPAESKLRQLEEDARVASEKADLKWFTDHLAPSWVLVSHREHTTLSKPEALALMAKAASVGASSVPSTPHVTKEDVEIHVLGKTGVVVYKQSLSVVDAVSQTPKVEYVTDVFTETSQGWVLIYTQEDSTNPEVA